MSLNRKTYNHNILRNANWFLIILKVILIKKIDVCWLASRFSAEKKRKKLFPADFCLFFGSISLHESEHPIYATLFFFYRFFCLHEPKKKLVYSVMNTRKFYNFFSSLFSGRRRRRSPQIYHFNVAHRKRNKKSSKKLSHFNFPPSRRPRRQPTHDKKSENLKFFSWYFSHRLFLLVDSIFFYLVVCI